ncbi:MAG: hypothetical protein M0Z91_01130 [Actinomycetota bacterium]|nr:hypothetical protein [Actinomycetota bacterium]
MARIRHTRPAIWTDRQLCRLSLGAHFIAVALPNYCDDEGRWEFSPRLVLAEIFPYRPEISEADVELFLKELLDSGYIRRYQVGGVDYLDIPGWDQSVNRPKPSEIPPHPDSGADAPLPHRGERSAPARPQHRNGNHTNDQAPSNVIPMAPKAPPARSASQFSESDTERSTHGHLPGDSRGKKKMEKKKLIKYPPTPLAGAALARPANPAAEAEFRASFEEFWRRYPRVEGKGKAEAELRAALGGGVSLEEILRGLEGYKRWITSEHKELRWVKHAGTFLAQRCWEDYAEYVSADWDSPLWGSDDASGACNSDLGNAAGNGTKASQMAAEALNAGGATVRHVRGGSEAYSGSEGARTTASGLSIGDVGVLFAEFWRRYPRKDAQTRARQEYQAALARGAKPEELLFALERYKREISVKRMLAKHVRYAATFLADDAWRDYLGPIAAHEIQSPLWTEEGPEAGDANPFATGRVSQQVRRSSPAEQQRVWEMIKAAKDAVHKGGLRALAGD